jgi:hypothetical protein
MEAAPLSEPGSDSIGPALGPVPTLAGRIFIGLALALLPIMIVASVDVCVTWDAGSRRGYGERVLDFLRGLRTLDDFPETGGHLYPGLFDTICAALELGIPVNRWVLRNAVNAFFGWVGIVYCGRLAGRLFGGWSGVLALALLALSPRYFGHSMNNPKDLPFAALSVVALYYISTISRRWPYVSPFTGVKITVALALALGVRAGALLYLGYFGLLIGGLIVAERITNWRRLADTAARVSAITVAVLFLGTVFWPWASASPLTRPVRALMGVSTYPWEAPILYRGFEHLSTELPWHYAPWWFLITTPPVVLIGAACSLIFIQNRSDRRRKIVLWVIAVFPIAAGILRGSTLYDGVRHLLFVYPVLAVLAAAGWVGVHRRASTLLQRRLAITVLAVGLASAAIVMVRFHPNQVAYFNALVGGPSGAFKRYDIDYWGNCMLQAVEWSAHLARSSGVTVAISGHPNHLVEQNAERYPEVVFIHDDLARHHLDISLARGERSALRRFATRPALHRVTTPDGALLCIIAAGPAYAEFERLRDAAASRQRGRPK